MLEIGVDLSVATPQKLTDDLASSASVLVSMGCGEARPNIPGLKRLDWQIADPKGQPIDRVREIRDEIHERVKELLKADCANCCAAGRMSF
jgi:arsenate reductase (thioredoxin)